MAHYGHPHDGHPSYGRGLTADQQDRMRENRIIALERQRRAACRRGRHGETDAHGRCEYCGTHRDWWDNPAMTRVVSALLWGDEEAE